MSLWTNIYSTVQLCSFGRYWEASVLVTLAAVAITVVVILVLDRRQRKVRGGDSCADTARGAGFPPTIVLGPGSPPRCRWRTWLSGVVGVFLEQAQRSGSGKGIIELGVVTPTK